MTTDLARKSTVRELVLAFESAEATVRRCFAQLVEAEQALNFAFTLGNDRTIRITASDHWSTRFDDADRTVEKMQRDAWRIIVERLEMQRAMSIKAWDKLQHALDHEDLPPITVENVSAFAARFEQELPAMLTEAVQEVFEWLRPRSSEYKRNSEFEVPPRVILRHCIELGWTKGTFRVNHYRTQNLIALENVFNSLAGNGVVAKGYRSALQTAIEASGGIGETELFRFKACKNGNLHLDFKRLDLLERLNRVAGGKRLRAA